jgi:hypothetical protein
MTLFFGRSLQFFKQGFRTATLAKFRSLSDNSLNFYLTNIEVTKNKTERLE